MSDTKPFTDHLEELRKRILYSAAGIIICSVFSFFFHERLLLFLRLPMEGSLVFIAPQEAFIVALKLSLLSGIIISFPHSAYHFWKFIDPGLKKEEKKFLFYYLPFAIALFAAGVSFAFFVVLPAALNFLLGFGAETLRPTITLDRYVSFSFSLILAFGTIFQLPLVMRILTSLGLVEKQNLRSGRKYAAVIIFAFSALLTPPDIFSQIALALPSILLYELGLLVSPGGKKA